VTSESSLPCSQHPGLSHLNRAYSSHLDSSILILSYPNDDQNQMYTAWCSHSRLNSWKLKDMSGRWYRVSAFCKKCSTSLLPDFIFHFREPSNQQANKLTLAVRLKSSESNLPKTAHYINSKCVVPDTYRLVRACNLQACWNHYSVHSLLTKDNGDSLLWHHRQVKWMGIKNPE
jgi:hypothetical protein